MITSLRRELLNLLTDLSEAHPEWRFGQLVENVAMWAKGPGPEAIWDVEDQELMQAIKAHLEKRAEPIVK